jgi:hypothetical protein
MLDEDIGVERVVEDVLWEDCEMVNVIKLTGLMKGHKKGGLMLRARGDIHSYKVVIYCLLPSILLLVIEMLFHTLLLVFS